VSPTWFCWKITHFVSSLNQRNPPLWLLDYHDAAWWPARKEVANRDI
jgi:hypothetical protein